MAALPPNTRISSFSERYDPSVLRVDKERGLAKERVLNTRIVSTVSVTLFFDRPEHLDEFETWWETEIKRVGWFDVRHPRTKQTVRMRFVGGDIGELQPISGHFSNGAMRTGVKMEYMK